MVLRTSVFKGWTLWRRAILLPQLQPFRVRQIHTGRRVTDNPEIVGEDGSWVNEELLQQVLGPDATLLHIDVQRATRRGDNYLSIVYRARVKYLTPESGEVRVRSFIVKGLPLEEIIRKFVEETHLFRRETTIYEDVLPRLYTFVDSKLAKKSFKKVSPIYYKTSRADTLVLEDLQAEGFVTMRRGNRLDLAHCNLVIKNIARLHVLSLAYTKENPGYISQFQDCLFAESLRKRQEQFYAPMVKSFVEEIRNWDGFSNTAEKLECVQDNIVKKIIEVCKPSEVNRKVLVHGDCWINNIMFKYSETKEPVDLCFVDFQVAHEGSPARDLIYFLFSSPRTDVREDHFEDLLQEYCIEFERFGKDLGYSAPCLTVGEIRLEIDRMAPFAFITSISTLAGILANPDEIVEMSDYTEEQFESGEVRLFDKVYASAAFREQLENLLPYFEACGVFE